MQQGANHCHMVEFVVIRKWGMVIAGLTTVWSELQRLFTLHQFETSQVFLQHNCSEWRTMPFHVLTHTERNILTIYEFLWRWVSFNDTITGTANELTGHKFIGYPIPRGISSGNVCQMSIRDCGRYKISERMMRIFKTVLSAEMPKRSSSPLRSGSVTLLSPNVTILKKGIAGLRKCWP